MDGEIENQNQINNEGNNEKETSFKKEEFNYELQLETELDDEYEKKLERDIESQCDFSIYVNKLEIDEKPDLELMQMDKQEIIDFKNYQIRKLKAYISSLEKEKEDLIENFKESTTVLLEKIKELEFKETGIRPETPMITKDILKKKGVDIPGVNININSNSIWNQPISYVKSNSANNFPLKPEEFPKKGKQRCPNCTKEFSEDAFLAHSLDCLRNKIRCKKCGEMIEEKMKKDHIALWRSSEKIIEAINTHDVKMLQMCVDHGLMPNKIIQEDTGNSVLHLVAKSGDFKLLEPLLASSEINFDIPNKAKETPLLLSITEGHTSFAKSLIDLGADITKRNGSDLNPLMLSCMNGMSELAQYLIKNDANINETNILGETPLKLAQMHGHEDLVLLLIQKYKANIRPSSKK